MAIKRKEREKSAAHLIPMVNWICKTRHREQK